VQAVAQSRSAAGSSRQILDYAKELSRWSFSDLQREVSRRLGQQGNPLLEMVRRVDPLLDETAFNDALTANLRRGRFLLLIVGDGIREGVEAITEYLQMHAGLRFSLGPIELPIYAMPDGSRLVTPRILARTLIVTREVVALPDGYTLQAPQDPEVAEESDHERIARGDAAQSFWKEFLDGLKLDDPEQPIPKPARQGHLSFSLPAPTSWLTAYRNMQRGEVGIAVGYWTNTVGESAVKAVTDDWGIVKAELGGNAIFGVGRDDRHNISEAQNFGSLDDPEVRKQAFEWLRMRVNAFVNVLRPRMRSAAADYQSRGPV
jgi:hypothetical protein